MAVDTKAVQGRRELHFRSFEEVLGDSEKLVSSPNLRMLGNWPLSQLLAHLATAINKSIDGISFKVGWSTRILGFFVKRHVLKHGMPAGFRLPKEAVAGAFPATPSPQEALKILRQAVERSKTERMTARHPVFGNLTHEEWTRFHLHHAELHLSFAIPG